MKTRLLNTDVAFAPSYSFDTARSYEELSDHYFESNTDYQKVGIMIRHVPSDDRTKLRNTNYENVRRLRGNQPNELFRYLNLRYNGYVQSYLVFYPEDTHAFDSYRINVEDFTGKLCNYYVECYIKSVKPLGEFPFEFRNHMYELHGIYLKTLRQNDLFVSKGEVIKYVNRLPPARLFFSLTNNKNNNNNN